MSIVYHYMSQEAARLILLNKTLRMTNLAYLNDAQEYIWFLQSVRTYLNERMAADGLTIPQMMKYIDDLLSKRTLVSICTCCFSRMSDDVAQWDRYASNGNGIALGFDDSDFTKSPYTLIGDVFYTQDEQTSRINRLIRDLEAQFASRTHSHQDLTEPISKLAAFAKNPHFVSEEEMGRVRNPLH